MIPNYAITTQFQFMAVEGQKQNARMSSQSTMAAKVGNLQVIPVLREYRSHSGVSITPQLPVSN